MTLRLSALLACLMLAPACGDDEKDTDTDAGDSDTDLDTDTDEGTDTDTDTTGGTDLCDPQDASTTQVSETQLNDTYPTPAGGTIVDGVYDLAEMNVYAPGTADGNVRAWRLVIEGDTVVTINSDNGGAPEIMGGTFAVNGTNLDFSISCPQAGAISVPFTATADEIWLFDPNEPNIKVYVKQ